MRESEAVVKRKWKRPVAYALVGEERFVLDDIKSFEYVFPEGARTDFPDRTPKPVVIVGTLCDPSKKPS
jgi:hypothetical protein